MERFSTSDITNVTIYTGEKGKEYCVCKCPVCSQQGCAYNYQGTNEQQDSLFRIFPNLKQLYIFGNPDPAVDTEYCNTLSLKAIDKGSNVCYSTSGVGGIYTLERLLKDVKPENVDYISFSIDSTDKEKMNLLKGINYPYEKAIDGIKWAMDKGYKVKIQPTLWSCNYMDAYTIIDTFAKMGVDHFSFHIGSVERANIPTHQHLTEEQIKNVHMNIDNISKIHNVHISCPVIYPSVGFTDNSRWYCMHPENNRAWLVFLRRDGIYGTNVPVMSEIDPKYTFKLEEGKDVYIEKLPVGEYCPISKITTGNPKTLCRYIAKKWN